MNYVGLLTEKQRGDVTWLLQINMQTDTQIISKYNTDTIISVINSMSLNNFSVFHLHKSIKVML